jgi:hypothetical protein
MKEQALSERCDDKLFRLPRSTLIMPNRRMAWRSRSPLVVIADSGLLSDEETNRRENTFGPRRR